ncbi:hypothetical protein ES703_03732 [subsurface metagenome]
MKKPFFIVIPLILLLSGCAPSYMVRGEKLYNKKQYHQALELFEREGRKLRRISEKGDSLEGAGCLIWLGKCHFALGHYRDALKYIKKALNLDPSNSEAGGLYLSYAKYRQKEEEEEKKEEAERKRVYCEREARKYIDEGISEYNKGYFSSAERKFANAAHSALVYKSSNKKYCKEDDEIHRLYQKAKEWEEKAYRKHMEHRKKVDEIFEKRLMEKRKNYGEYFKKIIIHFSKDPFTEECLIPHCDNYKVWTSGPGYKYINVSSPYMDKWRADYLLNILTYIGNFTQDNLKVIEEYYQFTRIYWRNSRTGKGWVYHSYWDVGNK